MENVLIQSGIIAFLFLLIKFAEMRIVLKENKPVKLLLRDGIIVFVSVFIGLNIIDQFMLKGGVGKVVPKAFTDNPEF
jgi:hypothetical protein